MFFSVLKAYFHLIQFDLYVGWGDFAALHKKVRDYPLKNHAACTATIDAVCSSVDIACIWYWKDVLCLQRSAVAACLLKHYGIRAQLVIGVQQMPFRAHAWVEVEGRVVNDKPYTSEMYAVLDRC